MLWLKSFHIVFVVAWFACFFALPRLFVYHCTVKDPTENERFKTMERRMFGMMTFAMLMATGFAVSMLVLAPGYLSMGWLHAKLPLVGLLYVYHYWCFRLIKDFGADRNRHS